MANANGVNNDSDLFEGDSKGQIQLDMEMQLKE